MRPIKYAVIWVGVIVIQFIIISMVESAGISTKPLLHGYWLIFFAPMGIAMVSISFGGPAKGLFILVCICMALGFLTHLVKNILIPKVKKS